MSKIHPNNQIFILVIIITVIIMKQLFWFLCGTAGKKNHIFKSCTNTEQCVLKHFENTPMLHYVAPHLSRQKVVPVQCKICNIIM